jgi:uncharacterized protein (AIM24 family)
MMFMALLGYCIRPYHFGVAMTDSVDHEENPQQAQYLKHLYRGSELLLNDKIVEAREALEAASRIDPDDPKCLSLLGLVYFRLDDFEPAQQIYELLVQRFPEEASLRVNLGLVYMKQGHADKALDEMNRGVAIDPEHQRAYGYLGLLYSERGEHAEAREAFRGAGQEAMVERMDEVISAESTGDAAVMPELTADTLPPDPEPLGSPDAGLESASPSETMPPPEVAVPAPGSPPPVAPAAPAAPAEQMQPLTSDGMTLPVEVGVVAASPESPAEVPTPVAAEVASLPPEVEPLSPEVEPLPPEAEPLPQEVEPLPPEAEAAPPLDDVDSGVSLDDEIDSAIAEAVSSREPWPSESGLVSAESAPSPDAVSADAVPAVESVPSEAAPSEAALSEAAPSEVAPSVEPAPSLPSGGSDGESEPIFSYATSGLIDLSAQANRMEAPQSGTLIFPVEEDGFIRAETLTAHVGDFSFEDAHCRAKGQFTDELMVDSRGRFMKVIGDGILLCDAGDEQITVLDLYDDFMYLRTEYLFAFESTLHWENGKVRGAGGPIELIHIRGEGRLALVGADKLRKVRLVPEQEAYVSEDSLAGWLGRISPQTLPLGKAVPEDSVLKPMLRCEGEGVLLVRSAPGSVKVGHED